MLSSIKITLNGREPNLTVTSHQKLKGGSNDITGIPLFLETQSHTCMSKGPRHWRGSNGDQRALLSCGHTLAVPFLAVSFPEVHPTGCTLIWSSDLVAAIWKALDCNRSSSRNLWQLIPRVTCPV